MNKLGRRAVSARVGVTSLAALLLLGVLMAVPAAAVETDVVPGAMSGFTTRVEGTATGGATNRNGGAEGSAGAWVMDTGPTAGIGWIGTNHPDGRELADLTDLGFWTYVDSDSQATSTLSPYIRLQVDIEGDGDRDMVFEWIAENGPNNVMEETWQHWTDLVNEDGWKYNPVPADPELALVFNDPNNEVQTLATYITRALNNTGNPILRPYPAAGVNVPVISLWNGQPQPDSWFNFVGEVDRLHYEFAGDGDETLWDFEPPTVTAADVSADQQTANAALTVDVPLNLSAVNGSVFATPPPATKGLASGAAWTVTDGMGVVDSDSDAVILSGTTTGTVQVTIPGNRIPTDGSTKLFTFNLTAGINATLTGDTTATLSVRGYSPVANVTPPSITGLPREGSTLTVLPGVYSGSGPINLAYQWQMCTTTSTGSCTNISGATTNTYVPNAGDIDRYLRVRETASNGGSQVQVFSVIVGPVLEPGDTVTLVDPSTGEWHYYDASGVATQTIFFGNPGDYPIFGDWNGDGIETPGLYRQSDGFVYLRNSNTQGPADIQFFFGNPGDIPLAGDFDGDGDDTVSIYRPSQGRVFVINALGQNNGGLGPADYSYYFGNPGDKPFTGDFNGDGIDSVGLHRESTGFVYFRLTNSQGVADNQFFFGNPGDRFVAGDWDGDNISTPALFRPSNTTVFFRYTNTQGNAEFSFVAGQASWLPVAGFVGN